VRRHPAAAVPRRGPGRGAQPRRREGTRAGPEGDGHPPGLRPAHPRLRGRPLPAVDGFGRRERPSAVAARVAPRVPGAHGGFPEARIGAADRRRAPDVSPGGDLPDADLDDGRGGPRVVPAWDVGAEDRRPLPGRAARGRARAAAAGVRHGRKEVARGTLDGRPRAPGAGSGGAFVIEPKGGMR
jgi:hypothetical protein